MQKKIKLLSTAPMSFHSDWLISVVREYFDLEIWDQSKTYDHNSTLILTFGNLYNTDLRCVIDNLWERHCESNSYVIQNKNWFWYNESLWYRHLCYDQYTPNKTYENLAFVPMRKSRPYRDFLIEELTPMLDRLIWSYVDRGKQLPGDRDIEIWDTQRYFNPDWYDQTYFSIVAESGVHAEALHPVFITEKTFKPIAYHHPFVVYGDPGTLAQLRTLGFETFDNLFDESYDAITNSQQRGQAIIKTVKEFVPEPYSALTQERLAHNHAHFFNTELIKQRIRTEILEPLLHYAETH